jgi:hypothetical protein
MICDGNQALLSGCSTHGADRGGGRGEPGHEQRPASFRQVLRQGGPKKAVVTVAYALLRMVYHVLADGTVYREESGLRYGFWPGVPRLCLLQRPPTRWSARHSSACAAGGWWRLSLGICDMQGTGVEARGR